MKQKKETEKVDEVKEQPIVEPNKEKKGKVFGDPLVILSE